MSIGLYASFHSSSLSLSPSPREFFNSSPSLRRCAAKRSSSFPHRPRERKREESETANKPGRDKNERSAQRRRRRNARQERERAIARARAQKAPALSGALFAAAKRARAQFPTTGERREPKPPRVWERENVYVDSKFVERVCVRERGGGGGRL